MFAFKINLDFSIIIVCPYMHCLPQIIEIWEFCVGSPNLQSHRERSVHIKNFNVGIYKTVFRSSIEMLCKPA